MFVCVVLFCLCCCVWFLFCGVVVCFAVMRVVLFVLLCYVMFSYVMLCFCSKLSCLDVVVDEL